MRYDATARHRIEAARKSGFEHQADAADGARR